MKKSLRLMQYWGGPLMLGRYRIPKELLSSAPFRCLPSRQGNLRTQNPKPVSKTQTQARSRTALQHHSNLPIADRNGANTTRSEVNGPSVYNPAATANNNYDKRPKSSAYAVRAPSRPSRARPDARRARQNTGNKITKLPPNGVQPRPLRNRISPARRCHRAATKIRP